MLALYATLFPVHRFSPARRGGPVLVDHHWIWSAVAAKSGALVLAVTVAVVVVGAGMLLVAGERFTGRTQFYVIATAVYTAVAVDAALWVNPAGWLPAGVAVTVTVLAFAGFPSMRAGQIAYEEELRARWLLRNSTPVNPGGPNLPKDPHGRKWLELFNEVGVHFGQLRFQERKMTRNGSLSLRFQIIVPNLRFDSVLAVEENLEIIAGMHLGSIRMEPVKVKGGRILAGQFWLHIDVENILAKTLEMDEDHTPISVRNAFKIGQYVDGSPITLTLREIAFLIVALRGRGKTNLINVIIFQLTRCYDVWLCIIDLKGGRVPKPWLQPWLERWKDPTGVKDVIDRPLLGWVATTRAEAYRMLTALCAAIDYRAAAGLGGHEKLEPTREVPAIFCVVDELAALVGQSVGPKYTDPAAGAYTSTDFSTLLTNIISLGRSECVDLIAALLRATVTMGGTGDFLSQFQLVAGLGVQNEQDARMVFGKATQVAVARQLAALDGDESRGAILLAGGDDIRDLAGKVNRLDANNVPAVSALHWHIPADLDEGTERAMDRALRALHRSWCEACQQSGGEPSEHCGGEAMDGFDTRWSVERAAHLYRDLRPEYGDDTGPRRPVAAPTARPPAAGTATAVWPARTDDPFAAALTVGADAAEDAAWGKAVDRAEDDWDTALRELTGDGIPAAQGGDDTVDPADAGQYQFMVEAVRKSKFNGMAAGTLIALLRGKFGDQAPSPATVYRWLGKATCKRGTQPGVPELAQPGGLRGLYYGPEYAKRG
jgi:hypothetical protein